jgi:WhiB family redox-sensing transcriptional regulator
MWDEAWGERARCRSSEPDAMFVMGAAQRAATKICIGCPVRAECLATALDGRIEFGVWGGLTERQRRALLRRRPDVRSWRSVLEAAQTTPVAPPTEVEHVA